MGSKTWNPKHVRRQIDRFARRTYIRGVDAGVVVGVRSWETQQFILGGDACATPANSDLLAGGIELGSTFLGRKVEGDDLVSD